MSEAKVVSVLSARNESEYLGICVSSVLGQDHPVAAVVVVDDGSVDDTRIVAEELGCQVITLPFHTESLVGKPQLAARFNLALEAAEKLSPDYILVMGGDAILPINYVGTLIRKFSSDSELVVASGMDLKERSSESMPRGVGRLVQTEFWREVSGLRFPLVYGWEAWLCYKAGMLGKKAQAFPDVRFVLQRATRRSRKKEYAYGKAMYALGYFWLYALGRCVLLRSGNMLKGWLFHSGIKRLDVANYTRALQKKTLWKRVKEVLKHRLPE